MTQRIRLLLPILLLGTGVLWAQKQHKGYTITLKDGTTYSGTVVLKNNDMTMLEMFDSPKRYQFPNTTIAKVEEIPVRSTLLNSPKSLYCKFGTIISLYGGGAESWGAFGRIPQAGGTATVGVKHTFQPDDFIGIGVGYETNINTSTLQRYDYVPLFLTTQLPLGAYRYQPMTQLDVGYTFKLNQFYKGGLYLLYSIGMKIKTDNLFGLYGGIYTKIQQTNGKVVEKKTVGIFSSETTNTQIIAFGMKLNLIF